MTTILLMAAALAADSPVSDKWVDKAVRKAEPVASCAEGLDCQRKWERARSWVVENSRFAIVRDTENLILTYGAVYANTDASFVVSLDDPIDGRRIIRFRAWCGNVISCTPKPKTLRRFFTQALDHTK